MGTRFELILPGDDAVRLRAAGEEALEIITEEERRLSLFRADSLVSLVNRKAGRGAVRADDEFLDLLALRAQVHAESGGAVDPTVGAWMGRRGFREGGPGRGEAEPVSPGMEQVRID
ncbi:MAG: FAD:protein FMN transferase, partial [Planctomycetota bacterium]